MFVVPAPAKIPDGRRRRPARCTPTMIRAPPSRPLPATAPVHLMPSVTTPTISPTNPPGNAPQVTAAAAVVAAAAAATAATAAAAATAATSSPPVVAPSPSPKPPLKETDQSVDPNELYGGPSTPISPRSRNIGRRSNAAHWKSIENSRPDGAHLASAAMVASAEMAPKRRELYYGAPPKTMLPAGPERAPASNKPVAASSSTAPPLTRNPVRVEKPARVSLEATSTDEDKRSSEAKVFVAAKASASSTTTVSTLAPSAQKLTRTRSRTRTGRAAQSSSKATIGTNRASEEESDFEPLEADEEEESKSSQRGRKGRKTGTGDDSVRSYLTEIGEVKLLDADTEVDLARQISRLLELERLSAKMKQATGKDPSIQDWAEASGMDMQTFRKTLRTGLRAKEHMVAANLRLVVSIAKKYVNRGLTFQDLIQEGSIGLIRGAEKFDGDKGFKFSTYATWWIRQAITRAIADHSRPIRLPVHVNDTISAISKTSKALEDELGRPPVEQELAQRLRIPVDKLRFIIKSSRRTISLETPVAKDGKDSNATLGSFIVWDGDTPEETAVKSLLREDLENVLNTLTTRERDVVRMRYGFDDGRMKTLEEIGSTFEVTRERIRQIEAKALRKLRHPNRNAVLREYVYDEP